MCKKLFFSLCLASILVVSGCGNEEVSNISTSYYFPWYTPNQGVSETP